MNDQRLRGETEKGRGGGAQNIARLEVSTSGERNVLSAQKKKTFFRPQSVGKAIVTARLVVCWTMKPCSCKKGDAPLSADLTRA